MIRLSGFFALASAPILSAAVLYDESIAGDISNDHTDPLPLSLGLGENIISGTLTSGSDRDLFTLTVPTGLSITDLRVLAFSGGGNASFLFAVPGARLRDSPDAYIALQNDLIGLLQLQRLAQLAVSPGTVGETTLLETFLTGQPFNGVNELGEGDYAFWFNETGPDSAYSLAFTVVPEPSTAVLLLSATTLIIRRRRK